MPSFGEELKRERELRRITLREVADATKINLRYLEALDRNDFKHLPGGVFNRGFVRAYSQFIGVDPEQMVSAYVLEERSQAAAGGGEAEEPLLPGTAALTPRSDQQTMSENSGAWLKLGLIVVLVAAVVAGGAFVYLKYFRGAAGSAQVGVVTPSESRTAPDEQPLVQNAKVTPQAPLPSQAEPTLTDDTPKSTQEPAPTTPPPVAVQEAKAAPSANDPAAANGPVRATIFVDRATTGRLNCDNRQIELLNGMLPGTQFEVSCSSFLIVDAADGGALRIGWPGTLPTAPGDSGVPLAGHRINVRDHVTQGEETAP
jgi:cytoskeletal protein RodZ